jgi:hypothetical protein
MILAKNTRFIVDGKIREVPDVALVGFNKYSEDIEVVFMENGLHTGHCKLQNIEIVEEKENYKSDKSVTWTQFICTTEK